VPVPAPPEPTTLTSDGGTVRAACTASGQSRLLSWTPAKGYAVDHVEPGPAWETVAAFRHGRETVTMTVTCVDDTPTAQISHTTRTTSQG
jgi:serine/threonine-protein kinase